MTEKKLPKKTLFFYGLSEMPLSIASLPLLAFIPNYYVSDLGLDFAVVALVMLLARSFDAVTDPLIGFLSDRTDTRWGRRRIWMFFSIPLLMMATYKLFFPDNSWEWVPFNLDFLSLNLGAGGHYLLFWFLVLWFGWSMLFIPYYSWAAELSSDYNERSTIVGWRMFIGTFGNAISKFLPAIALFLFAFGGAEETIIIIGVCLLIVIPITISLSVFNVPERMDYKVKQGSLKEGLIAMWKNKAFRQLIFAYFFNYLGVTLSTLTVMFFIRGVTGEEEQGILYFVFYYVANLIGIPFWLWLSKKIGKHNAWKIGLSVFTVLQPCYFFLGEGDYYWMFPITFIAGLAGSTFHLIPHAMKADVIDYDTHLTGEDRAAQFFAAWSFVTKMAIAIAPFFAFTYLDLIGFDSTPGAINSPEQILGLKILFCLGLPLFLILAILCVRNYPITQQKQEEIRREIDAKKQQAQGA